MQDRREKPWNQTEPPHPGGIAVGDQVGLWFGAVGDRFCHPCRVVGKDDEKLILESGAPPPDGEAGGLPKASYIPPGPFVVENRSFARRYCSVCVAGKKSA